MRFALLSTATTITADLPTRADATPTFVVKNASGGIVQTSTACTLSTVNTTLAVPASAGSSNITLTSVTDVIEGSKFLVGVDGTAASENRGAERVTVKSISGSVATLARQLQRAKPTGASFQSTTVSCAVAAASVATVGRHYRVEITGTQNNGDPMPVIVVPFDVVRYEPVSFLQEDDVFDLDPVLAKRLPAGFWWPALRDRAFDMILRRVAGQVAPGAIVGALDLTSSHMYLCRELLAETAGEEWEPYRQRMAKRFLEEFEASMGSMPVDNDQDGAVEPNEGFSLHTITLRRA